MAAEKDVRVLTLFDRNEHRNNIGDGVNEAFTEEMTARSMRMEALAAERRNRRVV